MAQENALRIFEGAVAIVTGGASGIGRALAENLARRGASVVLADRQLTVAQEVATGIQESGGTASAAELDVTNFSAVEQLVQETTQAQGRLDYMFNNAGIAIGGEVSLYSIDDWKAVLDVNLYGVVNGVQAGLSDHDSSRLRSYCEYGLYGRAAPDADGRQLCHDQTRGSGSVKVAPH